MFFVVIYLVIVIKKN